MYGGDDGPPDLCFYIGGLCVGAVIALADPNKPYRAYMADFQDASGCRDLGDYPTQDEAREVLEMAVHSSLLNEPKA
jgi:hypothetical protein